MPLVFNSLLSAQVLVQDLEKGPSFFTLKYSENYSQENVVTLLWVSKCFKMRPFQGDFWFLEHEKSHGAKLVRYNGYYNNGICFLARNHFRKSDVLEGALL
jgi:hypothetical protein